MVQQDENAWSTWNPNWILPPESVEPARARRWAQRRTTRGPIRPSSRPCCPGGFKPGEVVTLRALAKRLAIGDTPVREAVKRLISEGAFEGLPNRSARVPLLDRREIQQILDLRILLESNAAALAAHNITLHQIEQLREIHKAMGTAVVVDDSIAYGKYNMAFHFEIYRIADNKTLATLIEALWLRMAPFVSRTRSLITSDAGPGLGCGLRQPRSAADRVAVARCRSCPIGDAGGFVRALEDRRILGRNREWMTKKGPLQAKTRDNVKV